MMHRPAPLPSDDARRIAALEDLHVLDSPPEAMFDDVVARASHICKAPISLVSLVDRERQWFKARVGVDDARPVPACVRDVVAAAVSSHVRVLVVDDDKANLAALTALLTDAGYEIDAVSSGRDALDAVARRAPDVVLTDCAMHGLGGVALAERLHDVRAGLPILFMTGHIDIATVAASLPPDAVVLQKPLLLEQVCVGIEALLGPRSQP